MSLLALCKEVATEAGEETEVWIRSQRRGCARFSISELSQPMDIETTEARIRVARGKRVAEVVTTDLDGLHDAAKRAAALALHAPEIEGFDGFAGATETSSTSRTPPEVEADARTEKVAWILERIGREGLIGAGMLETESHGLAVATSRGAARSHEDGSAELRVWALEDAAGRGSSGHGSHLVRAFADLAVERETEDAVRAALSGRSPRRVEAGEWDLVMEPPAVAELLEWLGAIAFAAPDVEQGTSPFAGREGQSITGPSVDIVEDPSDPSLADPFDREGTGRRAVDLIRGGVVSGVLTDRVHAKKRGTASTGSALPAGIFSGGGVGPVATAIGAGEAESVDALISGMERGLYVRRLHYVNGFLDPRRAVMTGLSRDGCFLVEKGRIVSGVGNVRLTDSFLEMLARADAMTRARALIRSSWTPFATLHVPAIRFRRVMLTSGSR